MYLVIGKVGWLTEEKNGSKYLVFDSANENKEVLKKYNELWILHNDDLLLNKLLKLHMLTIVVRSFVFKEDGKFYPQIYLDECLHDLLMLEYDRIDISEGIDINKTSASKR